MQWTICLCIQWASSVIDHPFNQTDAPIANSFPSSSCHVVAAASRITQSEVGASVHIGCMFFLVILFWQRMVRRQCNFRLSIVWCLLDKAQFTRGTDEINAREMKRQNLLRACNSFSWCACLKFHSKPYMAY